MTPLHAKAVSAQHSIDRILEIAGVSLDGVEKAVAINMIKEGAEQPAWSNRQHRQVHLHLSERVSGERRWFEQGLV